MMTFEEFKQRAIGDAIMAFRCNSNFKNCFVQRISMPGYVLREWEEQIIKQIYKAPWSSQV